MKQYFNTRHQKLIIYTQQEATLFTVFGKYYNKILMYTFVFVIRFYINNILLHDNIVGLSNFRNWSRVMIIYLPCT